MNNIEEQIKNIENNIVAKEKKINNLDNEIKELKNESGTIYEALIKQQDTLLKKKKEDILLELKINNLKYENIEVSKTIKDTNTEIDSFFEELKRKKLEVRENTKKIEEIHSTIKKNVFRDEKKDRAFIILKDFFIKKKEHNSYLESLLKKKKDKMDILIKEILKINNNIFSLCQNIIVLDNKLISNLYRIKNYIKEEIYNYQIKNDKINENSIFVMCLNLVTHIIEKQQIRNELFHNIFNNNRNIKTISNNSFQKSNKESKLELELNTQEFLEFENFL